MCNVMDPILTDNRRTCEHEFTEYGYGYECSKCGHVQSEYPWTDEEYDAWLDSLKKLLEDDDDEEEDD